MVLNGELYIGHAARALPKHLGIDLATVGSHLDPPAVVYRATDLSSGELFACTKFCKALLRKQDKLFGLRDDDTLDALLLARARCLRPCLCPITL